MSKNKQDDNSSLSEQVCLKSSAIHDSNECQKHFYPIRELLDLIGDKWSVLIIINLGEKNNLRFSELHKRIEGISKRILSLKLQNLERDGMLLRNVLEYYPPRVEYKLTELGLSLLAPIKSLAVWAIENYPEVEKSRKNYFLKFENEKRAPWLNEKSL